MKAKSVERSQSKGKDPKTTTPDIKKPTDKVGAKKRDLSQDQKKKF